MKCTCDFSLGQWGCRCGAFAAEKAGEAEALEKRQDFGPESGLRHAWYSEGQRRMRMVTCDLSSDGTVQYPNEDGEYVFCTEIRRSGEPSNWEDAEYRGVVKVGW